MIAVCLVAVTLSLVGIGQSYVIDEYRQNMMDSADEVAYAASAIAEEDSLNSWMLGMMLTSVSKATDNHIFITDAAGTVVNCSDEIPLCEHIGMQLDGSIIMSLDSNGRYEEKNTSLQGFFNSGRMVAAVPVNDSTGAVAGYVFVSVEQNTVFSTWSTFVRIVLAIVTIVFIGIMIFAFNYSKRMSEPLDEMASASRMFARGDFSVRVRQSEDASYEMGALIESFNKMADSLEKAENRRSEFISNISHELRTPMTTIAGFADGILDGTIPPEDEKKYLVSIRDETRRLARLVRNMLDVSKMKAMASDVKRRSVFDLTELMLQTLLSFESRAVEKRLDVDPQFPDKHIMVCADKDGITQVIFNLLDNAVKFAHNDTCITLRLYQDGTKAYVSVKDVGETIPPDDLPYIFDRFHKSDRSRSIDKDGVGLGLYLVKTIINGHDEDIAVKSENNVTEFAFTLPLAQ